MRITNRIITNNSLTNINRVKVSEDNLNTQLTTGKKITRPSDDPVIAIRALRLRSNASKVEQYYEKNTEDAEAWMKITDTALANVSEVLTDMMKKCDKGSADTMDTPERLVLLESMKALAEEVYSTGDSDYAGRSVFTGYRTDSTLTFQEDTTLKYSITEQLDKSNIDSITHVYTDDLMDFTKTNYDSLNVTEQDVQSSTVYRIQLSYSDTDSDVAPTLTYTDDAGVKQTVTATTTPLGSDPDPYANVAADGVNYIPETGELIIGADLYSTLTGTRDDATTTANEGEIQINYQKSSWADGDLKPEHYFACTSTDAAGKETVYNPEYLTGGGRQTIEYTTGTGQSLQINTLADECFTHNISRMVDELSAATEQLSNLDDIVKILDTIVSDGGLSGNELTAAEDKLAAAKKAQTLQKDVVQKMFSSAITKTQGFIDQTSLASTNCGSRESRLSLIQNRLADQQTTIDTLVSENEDCDETEVAVELAAAKLAYEAALMATSKITETNLLNYI